MSDFKFAVGDKVMFGVIEVRVGEIVERDGGAVFNTYKVNLPLGDYGDPVGLWCIENELKHYKPEAKVDSYAYLYSTDIDRTMPILENKFPELKVGDTVVAPDGLAEVRYIQSPWCTGWFGVRYEADGRYAEYPRDTLTRVITCPVSESTQVSSLPSRPFEVGSKVKITKGYFQGYCGVITALYTATADVFLSNGPFRNFPYDELKLITKKPIIDPVKSVDTTAQEQKDMVKTQNLSFGKWAAFGTGKPAEFIHPQQMDWIELRLPDGRIAAPPLPAEDEGWVETKSQEWPEKYRARVFVGASDELTIRLADVLEGQACANYKLPECFMHDIKNIVDNEAVFANRAKRFERLVVQKAPETPYDYYCPSKQSSGVSWPNAHPHGMVQVEEDENSNE